MADSTADTVLMIAEIDQRGPDFQRYRDMVEEKGLNPLLMDMSMEIEPPFEGDITCEEVAEAAGYTIEEIRDLYNGDGREEATDAMIEGAKALATDLYERGEVQGVFGAGGATSTLMATSVMKELPYGVPKVVASSVASHPRYAPDYVDTSDITMHHTVLDVSGDYNPLLKRELDHAVAAVCGMVEHSGGTEVVFENPVVGVTAYGFAERCSETVIENLKAEGFDPVPCHAQGRGDRAMDDLIRDGQIVGVVDIVTRGVVENLLDGNCDPGPDRILAASETGIPQVITPSGNEMVSYAKRADLEERFGDRPKERLDETKIEVRTSVEECRQVGREMAERVNASTGPVRILVPTQGWSSIHRDGETLWDPEADGALVEALREHLDDQSVLVEVDDHLYTESFGNRLSEAFLELWEGPPASRPE